MLLIERALVLAFILLSSIIVKKFSGYIVVRRFLLLFVFLLFSVISSASFAWHFPSLSQWWKGSLVSFGFSNSTGNTSLLSVNGALKLNYSRDYWSNHFQVSLDYGEDKGVVNRKAYFIENDLRRFLNKSQRNFLALTASNRVDYFSPFNYVSVIGAAYGRDFIRNDKVTLSGQLGPGLRHSKERDDGEVLNRVIAQPQVSFTWNITPKASFTQVLRAEIGNPYNYYTSTTSFNNKIMKRLATSISFWIEHYSALPPNSGADDKKTSTTTNIRLIYSF